MSEKKFKISIVIPCYNDANYVGKAIESVTKQDIDSIEIIVVNDGSTDNTVDIVGALLKEHSSIRLITQPNKGQSSARNTGLDQALGEYVLFLDADDFISPCCLGTLYETAIEHDSQVVLFGTRFAKPEDFKNYPLPHHLTIS